MSLSAGSITARASSGSRSSISSVEPLISANSAVTVLRSPSTLASASAPAATRTVEAEAWDGPGRVDAVNGAAHSLQNFSPSGFSAPHFEQRIGLLLDAGLTGSLVSSGAPKTLAIAPL